MKAKKSFGQHFLNSELISEKIAKSLLLSNTYEKVLEVGPGRGMLTQFLLKEEYNLIVVEADQDMILYLQKHFPQLKDRIIAADFLKVPIAEIMDNKSFGLIGNFPYNISSQILFKMLEYKELIPEMVGMFQKEVAERVIAPPGNKIYGVISVLIQAHYKGTYLFTVDKKKFTPPPKVQSAVIRLERRPESLIEESLLPLFTKIVKQTFGQRRKMLRNTMKAFLDKNTILSDPFFQKRPEVLSVEEFIELTHLVQQNLNK